MARWLWLAVAVHCPGGVGGDHVIVLVHRRRAGGFTGAAAAGAAPLLRHTVITEPGCATGGCW